MTNQSDVRRIALSFPGTGEEGGRFAFHVVNRGRPKSFAWVWLERVHAGKARVPNTSVLAVRVGSLAEKDALIASHPDRFFTEPHYNGYPAVLIRLEKVEPDELEVLLEDAWRCQAPKALVKEYDGRTGPV